MLQSSDAAWAQSPLSSATVRDMLYVIRRVQVELLSSCCSRSRTEKIQLAELSEAGDALATITSAQTRFLRNGVSRTPSDSFAEIAVNLTTIVCPNPLAISRRI